MPETAAVYWESKVRIYGFKERTGLQLCSLVIPTDQLEYWGALLAERGQGDANFEMALLRPLNPTNLQLCLVTPPDVSESRLEMIREGVKRGRAVSLSLDFPVELISFHGPHFQDRYGIVQSVIDLLAGKNIPLLATGCAGTSIGIVVRENCSKKAIHILAETFVVPRSVEK